MAARTRQATSQGYYHFLCSISYTLFLQGMFAGEVGVPRLLKLFDKYKIKTTWFVPGTRRSKFTFSYLNRLTGHSLETFPEQMKAVRDAGHEL